MSYSLYCAIPEAAGPLAALLQEKFTPGNALFGREMIDGSRTLETTDALSYKKKQKGCLLLGFNYSCPDPALHEYLWAVVTLIASRYGVGANLAGKPTRPSSTTEHRYSSSRTEMPHAHPVPKNGQLATG